MATGGRLEATTTVVWWSRRPRRRRWSPVRSGLGARGSGLEARGSSLGAHGSGLGARESTHRSGELAGGKSRAGTGAAAAGSVGGEAGFGSTVEDAPRRRIQRASTAARGWARWAHGWRGRPAAFSGGAAADWGRTRRPGGEEGEGWWGPQGQNRLFTAQLTVAGWKTRRSVTEGTKVELGVK